MHFSDFFNSEYSNKMIPFRQWHYRILICDFETYVSAVVVHITEK